MRTEYAIELRGHEFDLGDLREIFNSGPIRVRDIEVASGRRITALMADEFNDVPDTSVMEIARQLMGQINGALFASDINRSIVRLGPHYTRRDGGAWGLGTIYAAANIKLQPARMRGRAMVLNPDGTPVPSPETRPRQTFWLELAAPNTEAGNRVADVLHALSGEPDWFDLWKAQEVVYLDRNKIPDWPSDDIEWFRSTATLYRHSRTYKWGKKARGRLDDQQLPEMDLETARRLIGRVAAAWLDWMVDQQSPQTFRSGAE